MSAWRDLYKALEACPELLGLGDPIRPLPDRMARRVKAEAYAAVDALVLRFTADTHMGARSVPPLDKCSVQNVQPERMFSTRHWTNVQYPTKSDRARGYEEQCTIAPVGIEEGEPTTLGGWEYAGGCILEGDGFPETLTPEGVVTHEGEPRPIRVSYWRRRI